MQVVQFNAVVDREQVIRPPAGITLPEGEIEVTVRRLAATSAPSTGDAMASTRDWLLALASAAERAQPQLPADLAEHHDRYAHGKPPT